MTIDKNNSQSKMNAMIYCRVSTKEQAKSGYSLSAQEEICRKFANRNGYKVLKVFIEKGESGKNISRTEFDKLLKFTSLNHKNINALIVYKVDRLSRNHADSALLFLSFDKLGIEVKSATENINETPTGIFLRNILTSVAQFDNDVRRVRTIIGMKEAVKEGRWCWPAPIGYTHSRDSSEKDILIPTKEAKFIKEAFKLAESGLYNQVEIVERLKKKGFNRASRQQINRMLKNPIYAGQIKVDWFLECINAIHPPIISKKTFSKVQLILNGKRPKISPHLRNHPDFPLRRFVQCSHCGQKLTGSWSTGRRKKRYPYYHCRTIGCSLNVRKEKLETAFINYLKSIQPNEDVLDLFEAIILDVWERKQSERINGKRRLEKEIKDIEKRQSRLLDLLIEHTIKDDETYRQKTEELNNELLDKKVELDENEIELNDVNECINYCKFFLSNIADLWASAELNLKQRFQTLIFPEGICFDSQKFGTAKTALIFKHLQEIRNDEYSMAALRGFEPRSDG